MRRTKTRVLALGAILSALAVVVMMLGGLIPAATFCCPILAGFVLIPVLFEGGAAMALCAWGAAAILSLLLGPDKEAAMLYALLLYVLGLDALRAELAGMGKVMLIVTLLMGNAVFVLFDFTLPRVTLLYQYRFRPRFWK